jgi:hypothetical protein
VNKMTGLGSRSHMQNAISFSAFFGILLFGAQDIAIAADACAPLIPEALKLAIAQSYPDYRLPRQSDYDKVDIKYNVEHGGSGCLGIAAGSYYRKNAINYAINVTSKTKTHTLLIVADRLDTAWKLELLRDWGDESIGRIYVDTEEPGTYERTEALDGPISEPGERERYTSKRQGLVAGAIESSGAAFFFDGKGWVHVWISD